MGELDFVVKKGLNVKNGDVTITSGNLDLNNGYADIDNIKIDGNSIISTDTNGNIDLTPNGNGEVNISKVDINGGTLGGITIDGNWTAASQTCANLGTVSAATSISSTAFVGAIDGALGGTTPAAASVTTLTASGATTLDGAVTLGNAAADDITNVGSWVGDFVPKVDGAIDLGTALLQFAEAHIDTGHIDALTVTGTSTLSTVDIGAGAIDGTIIGAASATTATFTGVTIDQFAPRSSAMQHKIGNNVANAFEIIQGSDSYMKAVTTTGSESIVLSPEPIGGAGGVCKVVIGDNAAEDTMIVFDGAEIEYRLGIDDSANQFEIGVGEAHDTTPVIVMDNAGNIIQLGQDSSPSNGEVLAYDGSKWTAAASASGADGMGSGFVLEDGDGTEVTIDEDKEVKFIDGDGIDINWTDTSPGSDGDPYDLTFSLDIDGMTDIGAGLASGDLFIVDDGAGGTNRKTTVDRIATLFAGTGLTASGAVIGVDAAQTQITSVGTIGTGTWQGTAIASAYLDADTAHLSGTQTFSGAKTFSANATLAGFVLDGNTITGIDDSEEFTDDDVHIMTSAGINDKFGVIAGSSSIVTVGTITSGTWEGTAIASANLDADTAHLSGTQTFSGAKTFSASVDMNAGATIDGATISLDATTALNIDNSNTSNGISIGTATSAVPITIGHGTSETTFGDNVTISGNLTVNGAQTIIDSTTVISEDKTFILGLTGGMADATYARSGTTVTVTSASHGFSSNEYVLVQDAGNSITDDVYTITVTNTNTFTFTSPASGTVSGGATMLHSTNDTTEAIADGAGIYAPGTSLHSLQYDSSNGWLVSDDLDIANTKHISFNGSTKLTATEWFGTTANSMTSASSLATVGALGAGSITSGFGAIDNGTSNITTGGIISIDVDNALTIATNVTGIGVAGSVTLGAGADAGLYVNGDNLYIENKTTDKDIIFRVSDNGTYTTVATIDGDVSLFNFVTDKLGINGTAVTSTAAELNLIDGSSVGTVANSKAVIYSAAGQVEGTTLGINSKAVIQTNANANASEGTSSSGGPIDIFSFAHATYRAAKILLSIDRVTSGGSAALAYETAEILINHDGTNVYYTTYGYISSEATQLATITAAISGNDVVVKYDPVAGSTDVFNFEAIATLIIV